MRMCDTTGVTSVSLRNPDLSPVSKEDSNSHNQHHHHSHHQPSPPTKGKHSNNNNNDVTQTGKQNQVGCCTLFGVPIVSLVMDGKERLCLAQISSTLLKNFSYNEIHNRRVALGITCVQCTPVQLEILRRAGAMPVTSRRCGMITRREAERLCQSFLGDHAPPQLPENFAFEVYHECGWGCRGSFVPSRYNSSRAKCIRCTYCQLFFSPNKFIFHSHRLPESRYVQPDAANFNSWRRHLKLCGDPPDDDCSSNTLSMDTAQIVHAWEDVRAMFNGGTRKRMLAAHSVTHHHHRPESHSQTNRRSNGGGKISNNSTGGNSATVNGASRSATPQQNPQNQSRNNNSSNNNNNHIHSPIQNSGFNSSENQSSSVTSLSPNSFLSVQNPLLSPTNRLENIWNPGLSPVTSMNATNKLGSLTASTPLPHLPFHPLSIPWLRRPLFPFPHPFTPAACHLLADAANMSVPEKLASLSASATSRGNSNQSAFKPVSVSRNAEHLFTWLNNNNSLNHHNNSIANIGINSGVSLPEDLSLNSTTTLTPLPLHGNSPVSSTNTNDENHGTMNNKCHQIQILSSFLHDDSNDEVDIESTEIDEDCSSTSFVLVSSSSSNIIHGKRGSTDDEKSGGALNCDGRISPKRKRLWDFDSSERVKKCKATESHTLNREEEETSGFGLSKD